MGKQPSRTPAEAAAAAAELLREATRAADFLTDGSLYNLADKARGAIAERDKFARDVDRQADEIKRLEDALNDATAYAADLRGRLDDAERDLNAAQSEVNAAMVAAEHRSDPE